MQAADVQNIIRTSFHHLGYLPLLPPFNALQSARFRLQPEVDL